MDFFHRPKRLALSLLLAALLTLSVTPTTANHLQTVGSESVAFDHIKGNEWWVEVRLTGQTGSISNVQAQDVNSPWTSLSLNPWGVYAGSFHIEPGNQVRFRASIDAVVITSCWFTHPAGVEMCEPQPPVDSSLDSLSHLRYVEDGTQEIAHLTYTLDQPVALENLTELRFFQELVHGSGAYGFNVILGVNANGATYTADDMAWHLGATQHSAAVLGTDTFLEMDGAPSDQFIVDAPDVPQWWTPNAAGTGFAGGGTDPDCYATLETVVNDCTDVRFEPTDKVHVIRLILGGSGSWNDTAMRATTDIDGTLTVGVKEAT